MKLSIATFLTVLSAQQALGQECGHPTLPYSDQCAIKLERLGSVPTATPFPFSYNFNAFDNFSGDCIFFVDQLSGIIYSHKGGSSVGDVTKVWDMSTDAIPDGLELDYEYFGTPASTYRVKSMAQGTTDDEIIVVFTSGSLPTGWTEPDAKLPAPTAVQGYACRTTPTLIEDVYRPFTFPDCADAFAGVTTRNAYDVFYKFKMVDGKLTDPVPFLTIEMHVAPGHLGGAIAPLPNGDILWATGDNTVFGMDGSYAPQFDDEHVGKILRIDPTKRGSYSVVAKGVRNSQQMRCYEREVAVAADEIAARQLKKSKANKSAKKSKKSKSDDGPKKEMIMAFMDIGGVTAEEVNAFPLSALDSGSIMNFGWGRSFEDGSAREGTFLVDHGRPLVLGTDPVCLASAPIGEAGYIQPWVQFGRTPDDLYFGISSMAIPKEGGMLNLLFSEFNTGKLLGSPTAFVEGAPPGETTKLYVYDEMGNQFEDTNAFVAKELDAETLSFTSRGDPRLFHFPDGETGLLIERTGVFYKVSEMMMPQ